MDIKVLFIGSFKDKSKDGSVGGQMFASNSLVNSSIKNSLRFIKLDTTAVSVPAPPVYKRFSYVILRFLKFFYSLIFLNPKVVLIFSSAGLSFVEKGLMAIIAKYIFRRRVVFCPRSGLIKNNIANSRNFKKFASFVFNSADVVLCQGNQWFNYYSSIFPNIESKLIVQKNWLKTDSYLAIKHEPIGNHQKLIYMGWLEKYKGIIDLMYAARNLKNRSVEFTLEVYGNGSQKDFVENFIAENNLKDVIIYKGWADTVQKLDAFKRASIFVIPSHTEGMPNTLIEAMAAGLIPVASDADGIVDIIEHKSNGYIFKSGSVDDLTNTLEYVIQNKQEHDLILTNAKNYVINEHDVESLKDRIFKIITGNETNHPKSK